MSPEPPPDESASSRRSYFMGPGGKITADPKTARGAKPTSKKADLAVPLTDPVQVGVKLDRETYERLDEVCQASERTVAQTLRRAVKLYLSNLPEPDRSELEAWRKR